MCPDKNRPGSGADSTSLTDLYTKIPPPKTTLGSMSRAQIAMLKRNKLYQVPYKAVSWLQTADSTNTMGMNIGQSLDLATGLGEGVVWLCIRFWLWLRSGIRMQLGVHPRSFQKTMLLARLSTSSRSKWGRWGRGERAHRSHHLHIRKHLEQISVIPKCQKLMAHSEMGTKASCFLQATRCKLWARSQQGNIETEQGGTGLDHVCILYVPGPGQARSNPGRWPWL